MTKCLFCKLASGEIEPDIVYEDEHLIAFRDVNPQAPVHVLIIPRKHVATLNDMDEVDADLGSRMLAAARRVADQEGISERGYRAVVNCNPDGGQSVYHVHMHVLGGRPLGWPPG